MPARKRLARNPIARAVLAREARDVNVLWIVTTQWRAQACAYAGDPNARTPTLDRLAAQSLNYTQAVTPHPFGPFARAALLTGVPSPENGIRDYYDALPLATKTIAHDLRAIGYRTAFFGKWHLAARSRTAALVGVEHAKIIVPEAARGGFDFWEGFESGFQNLNPWLHGTRLAEPRCFPGYQSDVVCDRAGEWLATEAASPWFAIVSLEPPHPPYDVLPAAFPPGSPESISLRPNVPDQPDVVSRARRELAGYYAQIAATDTAISRLLARIENLNTAVVFTSVHGDMHGSHGLFRKGWPHEESVRVPLLVRVPDQKPNRSDACISLRDLRAATIELCASGQWPKIDRAEASISMPSVVALPHQCDRVWQGTRSNREKRIQNADGTPWLHFSLAEDPWELKNLAQS